MDTKPSQDYDTSGKDTPAAAPATSSSEKTTTAATTPDGVVQQDPQHVNTHSRDLAIGSGVLLVLLIAFFFAKNAYANMLVARRVEPRSANAAGWWLFIALAVLALGIVFGAIDASSLVQAIYVIPLAVVEVLAIVLLILSSRR